MAEACQTRADAMRVKCPYCYADPGEQCFIPKTTVKLVKQPAHFKRLEAAREAP